MQSPRCPGSRSAAVRRPCRCRTPASDAGWWGRQRVERTVDGTALNDAPVPAVAGHAPVDQGVVECAVYASAGEMQADFPVLSGTFIGFQLAIAIQLTSVALFRSIPASCRRRQPAGRYHRARQLRRSTERTHFAQSLPTCVAAARPSGRRSRPDAEACWIGGHPATRIVPDAQRRRESCSLSGWRSGWRLDWDG